MKKGRWVFGLILNYSITRALDPLDVTLKNLFLLEREKVRACPGQDPGMRGNLLITLTFVLSHQRMC